MAPTSVWTETSLGAEKSIPSLRREFGIYREFKSYEEYHRIKISLDVFGEHSPQFRGKSANATRGIRLV